MQMPQMLRRRLRAMGLWPRLTIAVSLVFLAIFGLFATITLGIVQDSTNRILEERLVITQMAAQSIDGVLQRGFYELEKATEFAAFNPKAPSLVEESHMLAHAYGRIGTLSLGVYFLDSQGKVVLSQPPRRAAAEADLSARPHIAQAIRTRQRTVSKPFVDGFTGKPAVALSIPILDAKGELVALLSGLIDVSSPEFTEPIRQAVVLGQTLHAELVDEDGKVIVSTDSNAFQQTGEHHPFYLRKLQEKNIGIETTLYQPWHAPGDLEPKVYHVMAFAHLSTAPWGLSVGGTDLETFASIIQLRNTVLLGGGLSLILLWMLTLVGARLLVRPVKSLTQAAQRMSSGDLTTPVGTTGSGEIAELAGSFEYMREQLKASLDEISRWSQELEARVEERTAELAQRTRELTALSAVSAAAVQARDLDQLLDHCLEIASAYTHLDMGAIHLVKPEVGLVPGRYLGGKSELGCETTTGALSDRCLCTRVAATGQRVMGTREEIQTQGSWWCFGETVRWMAASPLRSSRRIEGVLLLGNRGGEPASPRDLQALEALGNQIGVAIENARLIEEVRKMEAQREIDRVKWEFISSVSHELRTPLGFIKGYATTLLRDGIRVEPGTRTEFLQIISEESDKLQKLIDELLDASRLHAGALKLSKQAIDLVAEIERLVEKAQGNQGRRPILLRLPQGPVEVSADPWRVEQVLNNLLENAVQYSPADSPITVSLEAGATQVTVSVTDQGQGIPAEELERVFEPFFRGDAARRTRGMGLGLTICRGIVEAHGGRIWAESVPGKQSTLSFTLPRGPQARRVRASPSERGGGADDKEPHDREEP